VRSPSLRDTLADVVLCARQLRTILTPAVLAKPCSLEPGRCLSA